MEIITKF